MRPVLHLSLFSSVLLPFATLADGGSAAPESAAGNSFTLTIPANSGPFALAEPVKPIPPEQLAPLEKALDNALVAYNSGDEPAFIAAFSKDARPPMNPHTVKAIFTGIYQSEFGNYLSRRLLPSETVPDPDYGQIVFDATFEKRSHVKVSANLVRQSGVLKLVQLRFEKMSPQPEK